ncbi:MAG TPA: DRTGG domain-containing protein [bacterium]
MILKEIIDILNAAVLSNRESLNLDIQRVIACDLMSDVLAFGDSGALLITGLINTQVIRTCEIAGIQAVVFVRGKKPTVETVKMSEDFGITVMQSDLSTFEACGRLFAQGLASGLTKV